MSQTENTPEKGNICFGFLGFCIPIIGLILFLVWNKDRPKDAKYAGIGALIGVIVMAIFFIVWIVLIVFFGDPVNGGFEWQQEWTYP